MRNLDDIIHKVIGNYTTEDEDKSLNNKNFVTYETVSIVPNKEILDILLSNGKYVQEVNRTVFDTKKSTPKQKVKKMRVINKKK